jgi:hypothetical protein
MSEKATNAIVRVRRSWLFTRWFSIIGFFIGGIVMFCFGIYFVASSSFSQQPPGTAACGHEILGSIWNSIRSGAVSIFFGTPVGAIVSAVAEAVLGAIWDVVGDFFS